MTLILIGSAYADFGGYSGHSRSSRSSSRNTGIHNRGTTSGSLTTFFAALMVAFVTIFAVFLNALKEEIIRGWRMSKMKPMTKYYEIDPTFYENKLKTFVTALYPKMQSTWQMKNIDCLREYMTDDFFEKMDGRLDYFRKDNMTDHTENISILSVKLLGWTRKDKYDYITVELETQITSYIVNDLTGEIDSGDINIPIKMIYQIDFMREIDKFKDDWKICYMTGIRT